MTNQRILLSPPHMSGREQKYIQDAFSSNWIAPLGPNVDAFENEICQYVRADGAVAVSSGTAAIHLALSLLGVEKGDIVYCPTLTFIASANPIIYQGAKPVFIDSEPDTWNISPIALGKALKAAANKGKLPKAIIVVNLYGHCAKMEEILALCEEYGIPMIEDAAESLGSTYKNKAAGTFGKFGVFSFNGNKIITTSGGGALISNDLEAIKKARFLATQSRDPAPFYQHSEIGYNYRLSNVLAGIGRGQLEVIEERVDMRRYIYQVYERELSSIRGFNFLNELENTRSNRWLTTVTIDENETEASAKTILETLAKNNIEGRHVWKPLHLQPLFNECDFYTHNENVCISEQLFQSGICLPSGTNMDINDQRRVINCIKAVVGISEIEDNFIIQ